jgi:hypothetical protein
LTLDGAAVDRYLEQRFRAVVLLLGLIYAAIEIAYVARLPLIMDEFDGAYEAFRVLHAVPFRDFIPYKTVIGYYIQALPAAAAGSVWGRLMAIKMATAVFNVIMLAGAAFYLRRLLRPAAVLFALLLLIVCSTFLERSAELRVDMLTAWAGLWSLLLLLDRRCGWAGALGGLSFTVSQKGAFYIVAANAALLAYAALSRERLAAIRGMVKLDAATAAVIAAYVGLWSFWSSAGRVFSVTFLGAAQTALMDVYDIRAKYWGQVLRRDPAYFALAGAALVLLFMRFRRTDSRPATLVAPVYAGVVLAQAAWYSQPWPYFFVLIFPTLFVLHAVFFDELQRERADRSLGLPAWAMIGVLVAGVIFPLRRVPLALSRDNSYQRYTVQLAAALLDPADRYLAGTDIIHDREQAPGALARLGALDLARVRAAPPAVHQALLAAMIAHPPKVVIGNYRVYGLPRPLLEHIARNYSRLGASVYGYGPLLDPGSRTVALAFDGEYRLDSPVQQPVVIDGTTHQSGAVISLRKGARTLSHGQPLRLRLFPPAASAVLDSRFVDEEPLYPNIYDW